MIRSGNPALRGDVFTGASPIATQTGTMTIQGTVNKTLILLLLVVLPSLWVWANPVVFMPFMIPALIVGFIVALVTIFKKEYAHIFAPIYAVVEGVIIGCISSIFEKMYPGIVIQAVGLTFGALFALLLAYKSRLIKATENFKLGVVSATGAIVVIYLISIVAGFFGVKMPLIYSSGPVGIIFSLFVVIVAALNLVMDFDFIESGEKSGAPKYMEWYGAFALMITLIWLYLEVLRLLSKLRSRQ